MNKFSEILTNYLKAYVTYKYCNGKTIFIQCSDNREIPESVYIIYFKYSLVLGKLLLKCDEYFDSHFYEQDEDEYFDSHFYEQDEDE